MKRRNIRLKIAALGMAVALIGGMCACGNAGYSEKSMAGGGYVQDAPTMMNTQSSSADVMMNSGAYTDEVNTEAAYTDDGYMDDTYSADTASETTAEGGADMSAVPDSSQKLIKTVDLSVETKDFDTLCTSIKQKTAALGGYMESSEISGSSEYSQRMGYFIVRVPSDKLNEFVTQVEEEGNVTYSNERTEDVTLSYTDIASHISALRTEQETLMGMLEKAEDIDSILAIQNQLTQVRYELESYESQMRVMDNQVDYSTVNVTLNEVKRETPTEGKTFGEEIRQRLSNNLYQMGQNFRYFAICFIAALPNIIVWIVIIVVIVIVVRKIIRKVKASRDPNRPKPEKKPRKKLFEKKK